MLSWAAVVVLAAPAVAQSNGNPAIDVELGILGGLSELGRVGSFPNGTSGFAMATTSCNKGSATVPWLAPMDPDHPFISFLMARDDGVRMQQISDRSFVKHGFFALANSQCDPCQGGSPQGLFLGLGCSDTYQTGTNGNRNWLGPPDEIDPWLGGWDPVCSYFDAGDPATIAPFDCDGVDSLFPGGFNGVKNRVEVLDIDLIDNGPERFYYQSQYTIRREIEANRGNNTGYREFQPTLVGGNWQTSNLSPLTHGSVLNEWTGADISSNTNGGDDGRLIVGVKVTGPVNGIYHYEYAIHNRDNSRGVDSFRIPTCSDALVTNVGFSDVDRQPNDWSFVNTGSELQFSTTDNPLKWNSIFNFWFDSDAAPVDGVNVQLDQHLPGPGAASVAVSTRVPTGLFNVNLGPGCSDGTPPELFAVGSPPRATLGNATFGLETTGNAPSTVVLFLFTPLGGTGVDVGSGCFSYLAPQFLKIKVRGTDTGGVGSLNAPIPNDGGLEGIDVNFQVMEFDPLGGPFLVDYDLSNGTRVRIGDSIPTCP